MSMDPRYVTALVLCLAGVEIRTGYEILKKAGRLDPQNKVIFAVIVAAMFCVLMSWIILCPLDPWRISLPGIVTWLGLGMLLIGAGLAGAALLQLRGVENIDHLVTGGLFAYLRHPMYAGFILWIMGWVLYYGAGASLLAGLVAIGNILFWRRLEEEKLVEEYGEEYKEYRKGTWF
jgi:protein-S-isoprenylcysteine O-methyltransferase Ste14